MKELVLSNKEMFKRVIGHRDVLNERLEDLLTRAYGEGMSIISDEEIEELNEYRQYKCACNLWDELLEFSKNEDLLEKNSLNELERQFHSRFWELYLPKAFYDFGVKVKRDHRPDPAADFYFDSDGRTIHIEAVADAEPDPKNRVPPVKDGDLESDLLPPQTLQRLANSVSGKIEQFQKKRTKGLIGKNDLYVIAVNGYRALGDRFCYDHLPPAASLPPPPIVQVLYGIGEPYLSQGKIESSRTNVVKISGKRDAPSAHFSESTFRLGAGEEVDIRGIAGVLYSTVNLWSGVPLVNDFMFVQNPYALDITNLFYFCPKRYVRKDLGSGESHG